MVYQRNNAHDREIVRKNFTFVNFEDNLSAKGVIL